MNPNDLPMEDDMMFCCLFYQSFQMGLPKWLTLIEFFKMKVTTFSLEFLSGYKCIFSPLHCFIPSHWRPLLIKQAVGSLDQPNGPWNM